MRRAENADGGDAKIRWIRRISLLFEGLKRYGPAGGGNQARGAREVSGEIGEGAGRCRGLRESLEKSPPPGWRRA